MVRVISAHHFKKQEVTTSQETCASCSAGDFLLLASPLHQIEVRDLVETTAAPHTFPSVDQVSKLVYSPVGRYLASLELREDQEVSFVRIYINWWSREAAAGPMRARIAGRVTPASQEETHLEMIELPLRDKVNDIDVCPSTGNLIVAMDCALTILKYSLVSTSQNKSKFVDFQECLNISLSYSPQSIKLVEDTVACLDQFHVHVFRIKIIDGSDENQMRSVSTYSFSSESESSMDPYSERGERPGSYQRSELANITARRRTDSSCEREIYHGGIRRAAGHVSLGLNTGDDDDSPGVEIIPVSLVEKMEKEVGSVSTPRILEQILGPCPTPPHMSVNVSVVAAAWPLQAEDLQATTVTMVHAKIIEEERQHDRCKLLQVTPVYWREFRLKRDMSETSGPHNPLQSIMYSHLMSLSLMFTSVHEGYLYHIPGHIRKAGRGVGVQRIATYPFTCPVIDLVLEPSLLHALTETGLETYTLKSGYHTVREAETLDDKYNSCPSPTTPLCLIGLRPFIGVTQLVLGTSRLVLLGQQNCEDSELTIYSLHLPSHLDLYNDMLAVADINVGAPHGFLQLVSEAHIVVRTWLHRLTWLQVIKPHGVSISQQDVEEVRRAFEESCIKLADHYVKCQKSRDYRLAVPYYRLSRLPLTQVLARFKDPLTPGTLKLIEELVLEPSADESLLTAEVADKIISLLGENSMDSLVRLVILSASLRNFKTKQSQEYIEEDLRNSQDFSVKAEYAVAAVLVGGTGDWLCMVAPVQLSETLLKYYHLLFDEGTKTAPQTFSDFALKVRDSVSVIFVEVCVSLIESKLCSLGQMLHLYLQTFMTAVSSPTEAADNAGVFQLFLETHFMELLALNSPQTISLDLDHKQALLTLVRSYLSGLIHAIPGPSLEDSIIQSGPEEMFGPRHEYLDHLPPFNSQQEVSQDCSLLKLQSLLCSVIADESCKETVLAYLDQNCRLLEDLSLRVLSLPPGKDTAQLIGFQCPTALSYYCKHVGASHPQIWSLALEVLLELGQDTVPDVVEARQQLLQEMCKVFTPEEFSAMLPEREEFQHYVTECRRHHQAAKLQAMIMNTGHSLLETLSV